MPCLYFKNNTYCEKRIICLMIPNEKSKSWHYLAVKKLSALLKETTSKHDGDFYYLNCLYSCRTENKFKSREKVCKSKDFCGIVMLSQKDIIVQFNQNSQIKCHTLFMLTLNL